MIAAEPLLEDLGACSDRARVGSKAVNLGRLIRAGFPVPGGFVVTTQAYHQARATQRDPSERQPSRAERQRQEMPAEIAEAIGSAYRALGSVPVAVRSSATAEDLAGLSMAGQYDTFLDITTEQALLDAVCCCWASVDSPRTRSYFAEHGIDLEQVAMAVIIQALVPADVAGVLFTANPKNGGRREMLIEASWGLGEAVVSGLVQPDVLRIERATGRVLEARIADKKIYIPPGSHEQRPVAEDRRHIPSLGSKDVHHLWQLALAAEDHFGARQDLEWAIHEGRLFLLQARPITTLDEAEACEKILHAERLRLKQRLSDGHGPWVVHNLGETLPHPTPLTWSLIRRFMSGSGGFGAMYRQAGFEPSPRASAHGFLERIAGRVYMDLAAAPEMFFENYPFSYDAAAVRQNPDAANSPPTIPTGTSIGRLRAARRVAAAGARIKSLALELDQRLRTQIIPEYEAWCDLERARDLASLSSAPLMECWKERQRRVLDEFAPQSLLPSLVSGMALAELEQALAEEVWDEEPRALAGLLVSARPADLTVQANCELYEVARGRLSLSHWLQRHGHRAADEFDLATPRWSEHPEALDPLLAAMEHGADPAQLHREHVKRVQERLAALKARWKRARWDELDRLVSLARQYLAYREDGKYYLMRGYALLREAALEMGRRLEIGDGIFYLEEDEAMDALRLGFAPIHLIAERKKTYHAETKIVPRQIVDSDAIETLGHPPPLESAAVHDAFALSDGMARGPARIVRTPGEAGDLGRGYVLVCRSTDPAWTPLFVNAAALIMECGGALSHGAVVAREMGIPAVVIADATRLFTDGELLAVDGHRGAVARKSSSETEPPGEMAAAREASVEAARRPPPRGGRERFSVRLAIGFLLGWSVYLILALLLPGSWLYDPSMRLLDRLFWPIVRSLGRPMTVAIAAAAMALLTMVGQRWLTDNARLREARRRASDLQKEAAGLPTDSPRRVALTALAAPVQWRVFVAAVAPLCVLLGPMVMTFFWFPARMDPASWNATPGTTVNVVATVDSNVREPISLQVAPPLRLAELTPSSQTLAPIRETLERLLSAWHRPSDLSTQPWEIQQAADLARQQRIAELEAYLRAGVPPRTISWQVRSGGDAVGTFPVQARIGHNPPTTLFVVLGDEQPPSPAEFESTRGPLLGLKIIYPPPEQKRVFWAPFAWLHGRHTGETSEIPSSAPPLARWLRPGWDAGWLLTYLAVYLPTMYLFRRLLQIA